MEQLALKVALTPVDALIAATAMVSPVPLCTVNGKHSRLIDNLSINVFQP